MPINRRSLQLLSASDSELCSRVAREAVYWAYYLDAADDSELDRFADWVAASTLHEQAFIEAVEQAEALYQHLLQMRATRSNPGPEVTH